MLDFSLFSTDSITFKSQAITIQVCALTALNNMPAPETPYQPYTDVHKELKGPGDARPTALQIVKDCDAVGKLKDKTILITGCSSGIGVETARALYETGAKLFLTARDLQKLEKVMITATVQTTSVNLVPHYRS